MVVKSTMREPEPHRKVCIHCGGVIAWRRWRASTWHTIRYCSAVCRRAGAASLPQGFSTLGIQAPGERSFTRAA